MYPLGHFGLALLFTVPFVALLHPRTQTGFTVYAMLAALLPDLDNYVAGLVHHGLTHTFAFGVIMGLVGATIAAVAVVVSQRTTGERLVEQFDLTRVFAFVALGLFVGVSSHVIGDVLILLPGTQPVSPFWPLGEQTYQFGITHLGAPIRNALLILIGFSIHAAISWGASPDRGRTLSAA
jgi:inner membrane protein